MTRPDRAALEDAEADAEGQVRVAEARLAEAQQDGARPRDLVPAEEAYASAVRRLRRCQDAAVAAAAAAGGAEPDGTAGDDTGGQAARPLQYDNSADWLEQYLLVIWRRQSGITWCSRWFLHGEAWTRIEALWRSWEYLRWEGPLGMSVWWRDHADYHLRELTGPSGPFENCQAGHDPIPPLPAEPAPPELRQPSPTTDRPATTYTAL